MGAEPPIELQDRYTPRISADSLQRDIFDAIRQANLGAEQPGAARRPAESTAETLRTATSANSHTTGNSYMDFDKSSRTMPRSTAKMYKERVRNMNRKLIANSVQVSSRAVRPLKILRRPFALIKKYWLRRKLLPPTAEGRKVPVDFAQPEPVAQVDERTNKPYCTNLMTSSIYTVYDFFPRQLVVQFSKLANLYFLFVAILQMIPSWSATGNYTTIVPLCVFVAISMSREGYEDWNRHKNDREENNREVLVARKNPSQGRIEYDTKKWKDVKVGDVVRVLQNEWIPADIVLLHSSGNKGQCSIETLALDGETTLKSREVPAKVQEAFSADSIDNARALVTSEDPNLDLFNFEGTIRLEPSDAYSGDLESNMETVRTNSETVNTNIETMNTNSATMETGSGYLGTYPPPAGEAPLGEIVPLGNSNIIYRGSALRNTASVIGVAIFTGPETKMQLNASRNSRTKAPKLQGKVNRIVMMLAAYVLLLSGFYTLAAGRLQDHNDYWYYKGQEVTTTQSMMGFIIMFNTLIPLSLYVSMEICKVFQQFMMQSDIDMYDAVNDVRCNVLTASLNEELGQVSYVFSDKTGTLTDNIMLFRKMSIAGYPWIHDLDLYFEKDEDGYLFHKAQPMNIDNLDDNEATLLEQLARLPRRDFGGRISNVARISTSRPSAGRPSMSPSLHRPSMGGPMGRRSMTGSQVNRPSMGGPSMGGPSMGRPSAAADATKTSAGASRSSGEQLEYPHPKFGGEHVEFNEPASSDRPRAARQSGPRLSNAPRPSGVSRVSVAPSVNSNWQSTAAPLKPQSTPSSLTLLEYIMAHPGNSFTERAKFFLLALALCHSASPEVDLNGSGPGGKEEIENLDYQASSPDELALVGAARDLGYLVIDRQHDSITVRTYPNGFENDPTDEVYKVLDTIEFTSSRKRMSVVVQFPDGRIVLMSKGADNVMIERLKRSLLGVGQDKKEALYKEALIRRSVEAELANENRGYSMSIRPSIDTLLQQSNADAAIQESGRRSMQTRRRSSEIQAQQPRTSLQQQRSVQNAVADATATAAENAARTSMSLDMNRSPVMPSSPMQQNRNRQSFHELTNQQSRAEELDIEDLGERKVLERTLEQIDEFSTEGLRTLLYGHRFLTQTEYDAWKRDYDEARAAISNRQAKLDEVSERLERDFSVTGASAIEDKLQLGVPESIDKLRRANIRMWMLTGDKRETAVNIGYSCRLIKDFSTVITLYREDDLEAKVMAALEELDNSQIAHCVVVVDGQTLAFIEKDPILMSLFVDLGLRADSAIVCRASPAQKASIVKAVRQREPSKVMLAIGDGANDIAMIQSADVGIGIAGREGLQAARSADFSIGQFRFLLKLLFVHGRWNYVRTCKYILSTFYKEFLFYMSQAIFQRNTLFSGTSVFESWSISMFNTLFTSLPVICVGILDQDLSPTTLIAVPELYRIGPENREFTIVLFFRWIILAMLECVMISFLSYEFYGKQYEVRDNSIFPIGVTIYASIVGAVATKIQFLTMMHYITLISLLVVIVSFGGYLLFNILIGLVYITDPEKTFYAAREFWTDLGKEVSFWATVLLTITISYMFDLMLKILNTLLRPSDVDTFQVLEKDPGIMQRLEAESELELYQGWEYQDKLDHSWSAVFRGKWPGQPRHKEARSMTAKRRKLDVIVDMLRFRKAQDYEKEIQEILERRQREMQEQIEREQQQFTA